jgi:signal transduction histidine kinase
MKGGPLFVATIALLLLATLWYRAINTGTGATEDTLHTLDDFSIAESALLRDVLSARGGTLRNYDPLVRETAALREAVRRLQGLAAGDPESAAASDHLASLVDQQEEWTEQLKSHNALLQNSLAQFARLNARLRATHPAAILDQQASSLAAAMLQLTLDTSPSVVAEVNDRLADISAQAIPDNAVTLALLKHARLLNTLLPETDDLLRSLLAAPANRQLALLRAMAVIRKGSAELLAKRLRYVLFAISLLLAGALVYVIARLRWRAQSLRRRAHFEHAIATLSTHLINSRPHEAAAHVQATLAELATALGAERAYFVMSADQPRVYQWCHSEAQVRPGWPEQALEIACRMGGRAIHIQDVRKLPPGELRDALHAAGLHGWLCVASSRSRNPCALGFDALRPGALRSSSASSLLRMALDAIAHALDREFLEHDRQSLEANLQQARRMETIGALTSGIAHNFNNIVGAILGYTETAQAHLTTDGRIATSLSEIRRAGERARDLIDQILTFGRRSNIRRARVSVDALVAEAKSLLDASLPAHVSVLIGATTSSAVVSGEPTQLQQVILNVCNNAAQAMDESGCIRIETETREVTQALPMSQGKLEPGPYVVVSVSDPGRGMEQATLEQLFEPFFTTRLEGNGLGLATVREIVLEHGGALNVRSAPGAGTRFEIWLPSLSHARSAPEPEAQRFVARGRGETVLVFDADRRRLLRHEELLAALGYEPVGFTNMVEAAAATAAGPGRFDAALLCCHAHERDIVLERASAVHAAEPRLPIILASASTAELGAPALADVGITEIIHQPFASSELARALARCVFRWETPRATVLSCHSPGVA